MMQMQLLQYVHEAQFTSITQNIYVLADTSKTRIRRIPTNLQVAFLLPAVEPRHIWATYKLYTLIM